MAIITVDGTDIEVADDERLNVIQAADRAGVAIPFYCWHPGLSVVASCRMCLVETGQKNKETGKVDMVPKLVPACQTPVKDGLVVVTNSDRVKANQNFVQEGLLLDHPVDCPICDQAGECWLQDYYFSYGHQQRRADIKPFTSRKRELGEHVTLFVDRCVMCSRCVRFTREVSGGGELQVIQRGAHAEIDIFPNYPIDDHMSGNVNDLCPVGALCSSDFLYQQRVWFMEPHNGVCTRCSTGCSIQMHSSHDHLYRIQPRYNPNANNWWMCDIGRFDNDAVHAPERLTSIKRRTERGFEDLNWSDGLKEVSATIGKTLNSHGGSKFAFVISPFLTVEEAFLLTTYARQLGPDVLLVLGFVPTVEADEIFKSGFTIRRERAPNRLGVSEVIRHYQENVADWNSFVQDVRRGAIAGAYITANYLDSWISDADAAVFESLATLIVQDTLPSPLARRAHYVIPGVTFAEKEGCYVNADGLIQSSDFAIRPTTGAHTDGQTFSDLLGRKGLYQSAAVLSELAATIGFFTRAAAAVPEAGLNLVTGTEKKPRTTALGTVTHPLPTFRSVGSNLLEVESTM